MSLEGNQALISWPMVKDCLEEAGMAREERMSDHCDRNKLLPTIVLSLQTCGWVMCFFFSVKERRKVKNKKKKKTVKKKTKYNAQKMPS